MDAQNYAMPTSVTVQFERFVIFLVTTFAVFQVMAALISPGEGAIPVEITLSITLGLLMHMWARENKVRSALARKNVELEEAHIATTAAMVKSVEAKDVYTHGHSARVQRLAVALARKLALAEDVVQVVSRSAILHDIGKVGVSDAILHKNGPLTPEQFEVVKGHSRRTLEILAPLKFLEREAVIAGMHHERYDGKGYPYGFKGDGIPLEAAVVAIADTFDAMNSDRPYRKSLSRDVIKAELIKGRDSHHSAAVVDVFLALLEERPELWERTNGDTAPPD